MNSNEFSKILRKYGALRHEIARLNAAAQEIRTIEIDPFPDSLLAKLALDVPSDSAFWLNHIAKIKKYAHLRKEAALLSAEAQNLRITGIDSHVDYLKIKLGIPLDSQSMPNFWREMEALIGFSEFARTLHILARLGIPRARFEAKGAELNTCDPDAIFFALIIENGSAEFRQN